MLSDTYPILPPGKVPSSLLSRLLESYTGRDDQVIVGPSIGEDATVIRFGKNCIVVKTDPITLTTNEIGRYAVNINANDIATMGAIPRWFLATLLLPEGKTDAKLVEKIFQSLHLSAQEIGVVVCGGHTEVTIGLDRPIVVGQMLGEVRSENIVRSSGLIPGDRLLLTKGMGIEATAILAQEKKLELLAHGIDSKALLHAQSYLQNPGISVLKEAQIACQITKVHAMHDPTEGGLATAIRELAIASNVGISLEEEGLFASEITHRICTVLDLNILGVISSGALLIGVDNKDAHLVRDTIRESGIRCEIIGSVENCNFGLKIQKSRNLIDLPAFHRDEISKILV